MFGLFNNRVVFVCVCPRRLNYNVTKVANNLSADAVFIQDPNLVITVPVQITPRRAAYFFAEQPSQCNRYNLYKS